MKIKRNANDFTLKVSDDEALMLCMGIRHLKAYCDKEGIKSSALDSILPMIEFMNDLPYLKD